MNMQSKYGLFICIMINGFFIFGKDIEKNADEKFYINVFGKTESKPIETGFFFYEGKYVQPPYIVKRVGLAIKINNIVTFGPLPFFPKNQIGVPLKRPVVPEGLTKNSEPDDIIDYLADVALYVKENYEKQFKHTTRTKNEIVTDYYKKLPCVKTTIIKNKREILINLYNGDSFIMANGPPGGGKKLGDKIKKADVLKQTITNEYFKQLKILKTNGLLIGIRSFLPECSTKPTEYLYELVQILNSNITSIEKEKQLKKFNFCNEDEVIKLFENYQFSKHLTRRVEALYGKWKNEHPEEHKKYECQKRQKPFRDLYLKKFHEIHDKGEEYWKKHKDELEKELKELEKLKSQVEQIK